MKGKLINKDSINDFLLILVGCLICSVGINMFLSHAKLLSGGVTGIALIIQYLTGMQAGIIILLLNIPLFILSFFKLDRKFTLYSFIGTISFSLFLMLTHPLINILNLNDELLLCVYGGALNGLGAGIVFTHNGCTGGFDFITMLLKKNYGHIDLGKISFALNLIIVIISSSIFGLSKGLYTLASIFISTVVVDSVIKGFKRNKMVFIITDKEEEIKTSIINNLHRGVTFLQGEGAYTSKNKKVLYSIIHLNQLPELKKLIKEIDPSAFMSIVDASEVEGKGFRNRL